MPPESTDAELARQYVAIRKWIGIVGVLLPFSLLVVGLAKGIGLLPSISDYHGSGLRDLFVGLLCAVGVFLIAHRGYNVGDWVLSIIAGGAATVVAWFPNTGNTTTIHFGAALVFFVALACISLFRFTKTKDGEKDKMTAPKRQRNNVYRGTGVGILLCIAGIGLYKWLLEDNYPALDRNGTIFWLETVAIICFSVSWLVKGETLRDAKIARKLFADKAAAAATASAGPTQ